MTQQDVINALNLLGEPIPPFQNAMIKKLAASNLVPQNRPPQMNCKQTHIAITGSEMTIFPFVTNISYLNNQSTIKTYYPISVNLSFRNLNMLGMNFPVQLGYLQCKTYCYVRIGNQTPQIQLSLLTKETPYF